MESSPELIGKCVRCSCAVDGSDQRDYDIYDNYIQCSSCFDKFGQSCEDDSELM